MTGLICFRRPAAQPGGAALYSNQLDRTKHATDGALPAVKNLLVTLRFFWKLLLSHPDAWGVALVCATLPLLVHDAFSAEALYLVGAVTAAYWLAFALNDYHDATRDAHDPVKAARNIFTQTMPPLPWLAVGVAATVVVWLPAFVQFGWRGAAVVALGALVMWAYSAPPLRLKSRPVLDLVTHAVFVETFPYWVVWVLVALPRSAADFALLGVLFLASLTAQLEQQLRDYAVDLRTDRTFATTFGRRPTLLLLRGATALLIGATAVLIAVGVIPPAIAPLGVIALPILLRRFGRREWQPAAQRLSYQLAAAAVLYLIGLLLARWLW